MEFLKEFKGVRPILMKTYTIIFHRAVWPERLYRVGFFEKSSEIRDSILSEIGGHWSESDLRQGKRGLDIAKLIGEGKGT